MSGLSQCMGAVINLVEKAGDGNSDFTANDWRNTTAVGAVLAGDESGVLTSAPLTVRTPASTGTRNLSVNIRMAFANASIPVNGIFSIERVTLRKQ
ncbi:MAG: hypothetical protein E7K72_25635 [Roseomonas mucosa]|nr:hypothetical protein [Roseomonas mucosa]